MPIVVAIDGPAGAGKSSVAKNVAHRAGLTRVDTGAMYRAVTFLSLERGAAAPESWSEIAREMALSFADGRVHVDGRDISSQIRTPEVTAKVSEISAQPGVRDALLDLQRRLAADAPEGAVLEGRDIGSVVLPDADLKIYLTASAEERARRRHAQNSAGQTLAEILAAIRARDAYDSGRAVAPLTQAEDAHVVDSTALTQGQVEDRILALIEELRT